MTYASHPYDSDIIPLHDAAYVPYEFHHLCANTSRGLKGRLCNGGIVLVVCERQTADVSINGVPKTLIGGSALLCRICGVGEWRVRVCDDSSCVYVAAMDRSWISTLPFVEDNKFRQLCGDFVLFSENDEYELPVSTAISDTLRSLVAFEADEMSELLRNVKATELLCNLKQAESNKDSGSDTLSIRDTRSVQRARLILDASLENPPSLRDLARSVGSNEKKLNHGFRALFEKSVHGYLKDKRMQESYRLIKEGRENISVVAAMVGYTPSHLSYQFRRTYGISPSEMKN